MTQSDQSGQDGPARRGVGRSAATETVDKSSATPPPDREGTTAERSVTGGSAKQRDPEPRSARASSPSTAAAGAEGSESRSPESRTAESTGSGSNGSGPVRDQATKRSTTTRSGATRTSRESAVRKPRRARLRLTQVDAWTVMKTSFLLSIALGIVSVVAVAIVWLVLGAAGVFDSMNDTVQTLLGNDFRVQDYIGTGRILGFTMILAVVDVVLLTAIATLAAFLYNLAATLLGGVEVTLTEDS